MHLYNYMFRLSRWPFPYYFTSKNFFHSLYFIIVNIFLLFIFHGIFYGESSWCIFSSPGRAISNDSATKVITVQLIPQRPPRSSECTLRNARRANEQVAANWLDRLTTNREAKRVFVVIIVTAGYALCISSQMGVISSASHARSVKASLT